MTVDGARLADEAVRFWTLAFRPGRTGLVYADRVAVQAPQVLLHSGIIIDELRRVRFGAALVDRDELTRKTLRSRSCRPLIK